MNPTDLESHVIYVWRRRIKRNDQSIDGWQAGFQPGPPGGVTAPTREAVIDHCKEMARRHLGWQDCQVEDL